MQTKASSLCWKYTKRNIDKGKRPNVQVFPCVLSSTFDLFRHAAKCPSVSVSLTVKFHLRHSHTAQCLAENLQTRCRACFAEYHLGLNMFDMRFDNLASLTIHQLAPTVGTVIENIHRKR